MLSLARFAVVALLGVVLTGCAGSDDGAYYDAAPPAHIASASPSQLPAERGTNHVTDNPGQALLQCVPYAREHSAIKITGDAYTWWNQAAGKYERGSNPAQGAVMVLFNYAGPAHGHVAVVRRLVSSREIRIDHANWLDDGAIYVNDPVVDVSAANDWSQVRVWNIKTGGWGVKLYPVQGFIGTGSNSSTGAPPPDEEQQGPPQDDLVAAADSDDAVETPVRRSALATPAKPARALQARVASVPVAMTPADRNAAAGSSFSLTADDLAMQPN
jgi:surface antigen